VPIFAGEDIPHPDPDSPFADTGTNALFLLSSVVNISGIATLQEELAVY